MASLNLKYDQTVNFQNDPPPPHGLTRMGVFTKQTQIVSLRDKKATGWKDALDKPIDKNGQTEVYHDPQSRERKQREMKAKPKFTAHDDKTPLSLR